MATHEVIISGPSPFMTSVLRAFAEKSQETLGFLHIGKTSVSSEVEKSPRQGRDYSELTVVVHDVESRDEAIRIVSEALREVARRTGGEGQRDEVTIQ